MKRFGRIATLLVLIGAFVAFAATFASATEETEDPVSTTLAEEPAPTSDVQPAVPVTTASTTDTLPDWTYRYMIPTGIVLAVLVIVVTAIQYFTRVVRRRYRIVKE
ncbi:MAG: hypothetical protein ACRDU9_01975 [Acidimicrobiia bacterium]